MVVYKQWFSRENKELRIEIRLNTFEKSYLPFKVY